MVNTEMKIADIVNTNLMEASKREVKTEYNKTVN